MIFRRPVRRKNSKYSRSQTNLSLTINCLKEQRYLTESQHTRITEDLTCRLRESLKGLKLRSLNNSSSPGMSQRMKVSASEGFFWRTIFPLLTPSFKTNGIRIRSGGGMESRGPSFWGSETDCQVRRGGYWVTNWMLSVGPYQAPACLLDLCLTRGRAVRRCGGWRAWSW